MLRGGGNQRDQREVAIKSSQRHRFGLLCLEVSERVRAPLLILENVLVFQLVDRAIVAAEPRLAGATEGKAAALEECDARLVIRSDARPYLLQREGLAGISLNSLDGRCGVALTARLGGVDEYTDAEAQVLRIEVDDVESANSNTLTLNN